MSITQMKLSNAAKHRVQFVHLEAGWEVVRSLFAESLDCVLREDLVEGEEEGIVE